MNEVCILDRWEGDTAVIEVTDEADQIRWQQVPRQRLPDAQEGDVLLFDGQYWQVDETATALRRQKIARRLARLKGRYPDSGNDKKSRNGARGIFSRAPFLLYKEPQAMLVGESSTSVEQKKWPF